MLDNILQSIHSAVKEETRVIIMPTLIFNKLTKTLTKTLIRLVKHTYNNMINIG